MMYGYGNMISPSNRLFSGEVTFDTDAQTFITTASITDSTQQSAINQLVLDLKSYSIWSKMYAIYPMVGGNATSHSYNLIDTSLFQLSFVGGWTHSSTGVLPNGTNGYINTGFNTSTQFSSPSNAGIGFYSRTNTLGLKGDYGMVSSSNFYSYTRYNATTGYVRLFSQERAISVSDSSGFFTTVSDATNIIMKRNSTILRSDAVGGSLINNSVIFSSITSTSGFSDRELSLSFISSALTSLEVDNLYTTVQAFQTTLSRNV